MQRREQTIEDTLGGALDRHIIAGIHQCLAGSRGHFESQAMSQYQTIQAKLGRGSWHSQADRASAGLVSARSQIFCPAIMIVGELEVPRKKKKPIEWN